MRTRDAADRAVVKGYQAGTYCSHFDMLLTDDEVGERKDQWAGARPNLRSLQHTPISCLASR